MVWLTHLRIVVSTLVSNLMEYSSIAAPVYASFGIDRDIYYYGIFQQRLQAACCRWNVINRCHD
jgi:hypothetical protein